MASLKINIGRNCQASRPLWPVIAFILLATVACRVEVGIGTAAAAPVKLLPTSTPTRIELPTVSPTLSTIKVTEAASSSGSSALTTSAPSPTMPAALLGPTPAPTSTQLPLSPAQSPPTRIIIPAIELDAPVEVAGWTVVKQEGVETSIWDVPDNAAGWHQNSALPGNGGNVVLSGHHNMGAEVFRYLVNLKKGDEIVLQADERDYRYTVTDHFILPERGVSAEQRQQNAQWIMPTADERLTLVTCWPYNDNSHRLIVVAK